MILAVDTSIGSGVAVVAPDGVVLGEAESTNALGHAEVIGTLIERALSDAGVGPDAITHVAAGMGPGPFTGLRIGIAAARAFALGRGIPVMPVVSHDAVAMEVLGILPAGGFAVTTDARRRENAVSAYGAPDGWGLPHRVAGPELRPRDADLSSDPLLAVVRQAQGPIASDAPGAGDATKGVDAPRTTEEKHTSEGESGESSLRRAHPVPDERDSGPFRPGSEQISEVLERIGARATLDALAASRGVSAETLAESGVSPEELRNASGGVFEAARIPIGVLGRLAAIRIRQGIVPDADEPLYLRSPDVKAPAPRKRVGS